MELSLTHFATAAYELYRSKQTLRAKDSLTDRVIQNLHSIAVPETMLDRVEMVKSGIASQKASVAVRIATEDEPLVNVVAPGSSIKSERDSEKVQSFLQGFLSYLDRMPTERSFRHLIAHDNFTKSRAWARIQPKWSVFTKMPGGHFDIADYFKNARTLQDVMERADQAMRDLDTLEEEREAFRKSYMPIHAQWCDADAIIPRWDAETGELNEVYEYVKLQARAVRTMFLDNDGNPRAQKLDAQFTEDEWQTITDQTVVTLCIRADADHLQVAILTMQLEEPAAGSDETTTNAGQDELIGTFEHGMGMVPYAYFPGRTRPAGSGNDESYAYHGLLDDALPIIVQLDTFRTQRASVIRQAAWSGLVVTKDKDADEQGGGDRPAAIRADEGGVGDFLGPGENLIRLPWVDADTMRLADQHDANLMQMIEDQTFGPIVTGSRTAGSGYEFAQAASAAEGIIQPFLQGQSTGYGRMLTLVVRACRAVIEKIGQPIPIRYVGEDGAEWVEMTGALAAIDWEIQVRVRSQPVGGMQAMAQTYAYLVDRGVMTQVEMAEKLGIRYPQRVIEERRQELLMQSQTIWSAVERAVAARVTAGLGGQQPGGMPGMPMPGGSGSLAPIMARLPQNPYGTGDASMGGAGALGGMGMPNMDSFNMAPGAPPLPDRRPFGTEGMPTIPGGPIAGQAQLNPGGFQNQDHLNALTPGV